MISLKPSDFAEFFRAAHGYDPFPWQARLAARICGDAQTAGEWPRCIALPTAAGKTACIDIAVFALARQADFPPERRTAPRRIFFVVDRRVVVDQAYDHARALTDTLANATKGVLARVAAALKSVAGCECEAVCACRPLDVYALRGGMYRESAWVRSPLQPTVITSTVDQVGSRLLFRGYGVSDASMPLHAALVGNDSLILLDEAHCARAFDQTMTLVQKYREWTEGGHATPLPFQFVTMSATPTAEIPEDEIERLEEEDRTHAILGKRINARKSARLVTAAKAKGARWRDELRKELVEQARRLQIGGAQAVGVIVNRVATARDISSSLRSELGGVAEVVLLTGRMRPVDRDAIMKKIEPLLSGSTTPLEKPIFVVATQTLEVGADLDFHALVTECASLDALRQRFGRLNRVAARDEAKAVVVVRADQTDPAKDDDPVYGVSLAKTWQWLNEHAKLGDEEIDFGIAAMVEHTKGLTPAQLDELNAPAPDAAVLLPAHLDMWCQTSPRPAPDPNPSYFLHGPQRGEPEVQVVFRADLGNDTEKWAEIVSMCPPSSSESLSVRLRHFKRWLKGEGLDERSSDVEGERVAGAPGNGQNDAAPGARCALCWRGPVSSETAVINAPGDVAPGGTYIVAITADADLEILGDFPVGDDGAPRITDTGDQAFQKSRDMAILRLRHDLHPVLDTSFNSLDPDAMGRDEAAAKIDEALAALKNQLQTFPEESLKRAVSDLSASRHRTIARHPLGGLILIGKRRLHQFDPTFVEPEDSWESASDRPYPLDEHCSDVANRAKSHAELSGLGDRSAALELAGLLHDAGKSDPRFQAWLHGGNRRRADLFTPLLAKSFGRPLSRAERRDARVRAEYPRGGRHELTSVRLAECDGALPAALDPTSRDLVLHLIAAHHGYSRPFAPVIDDPNPEEIVLAHDGHTLRASSATGLERLDSGVAERFWSLTRRYGWWGLPYLEALLRLADWACCEPPKAGVATEYGASSTHAAASRSTPSEATP